MPAKRADVLGLDGGKDGEWPTEDFIGNASLGRCAPGAGSSGGEAAVASLATPAVGEKVEVAVLVYGAHRIVDKVHVYLVSHAPSLRG